MAERTADLVDAPVHLVDADAFEVGQSSLVDGALLAALGARTVVGHQDHDCVVAVAEIVDEVEDPADLFVRVGQERGEALHEALRQRALTLVEGVPGRNPRRPRGKRGPLGDDSGRQLAGEGLVAPAVPPLGEVSPVALDPLGGRVMRRVAGPGREVQEEGQFVVDGAQVAEVFDGAIGQVLAQVVALLDGAWRPDDVVVVVEPGHELVRLAAVEAVPAVEAAAERPRGARARHVRLVLGGEVPLPDRVGGITVRPEDLGEEPVLAGRPSPVAGETGGEVGDTAHPAAVMIAPREQTGAGG